MSSLSSEDSLAREGSKRSSEGYYCGRSGKVFHVPERQPTHPELWCSACDVAFCTDHGIAHLRANNDHPVTSFARESSGQKASRVSGASRRCEEHDRRLEYFCKQCHKAVCGDCGIIGEHRGHTPIVAVKEIAEELKQSVLWKLGDLKTTRLPCVEKVLSSVDKVCTELSARAEEVRASILSSRKSVIDVVELLFEQKLAEVDDLEEVRLKHLRSQSDELKVQADGLKSVIRFGEKVFDGDVNTDHALDLLCTIDKRAGELEKTQFDKQPVEHAYLRFEKVNESEILVKASELVGVVLSCHASATHSVVEGETKKTCTNNLPVSFVVVAKDKDGRRLTKGGDFIRAEPCQTGGEVDHRPCVEVLDKKDGTYMISLTAQAHGEFSFDVFINNLKLQQGLSISCCREVYTRSGRVSGGKHNKQRQAYSTRG